MFKLHYYLAREWLASYSIPRAVARLSRLREESDLPEKTKMAKKQEIQKKMKSLDVEVKLFILLNFWLKNKEFCNRRL